MGTLTSNSFDTRAGSGTIQIAHFSLPSDNHPMRYFEVSSLESVSIEFDIEEQSNEAGNIFFLPAKFNFSAFDKLSSGGSLFETLDVISSTDDISVTFSFTTDGGWSWTDDSIVFTTNDMEYDREKREVSFNCIYKLNITDTISTFFANTTRNLITQLDGSFRECVPVKNFIDELLADYFPTGTDINNSANFSSDPTSGYTWVLVKDHSSALLKQETDLFKILYRIAACEGSIVASMLGYNFFTNRLDTTENTTISEDDTLSLKIRPGLHNYRSIGAWFYSILGTDLLDSWSSHDVLYGDSDNLNNEAIKDLNIAFYMLEMQPAIWDNTNSVYDDDGFGFEIDTGADLSKDINKGELAIPVSSDPGLVENDLMTFSDKRELYIVEGSNADRIILKTPIRRDITAEFSTGGNKAIRKIVNTTRQTLASNAIDCYAKAYGADGSRLISIELIDIDTLKPYQTFSMDSSFPTLLQGQTFRPSSIEYDLVSDTIKIEAYNIG